VTSVPAYLGSTFYAAGARAGKRISRSIVALFTWVESCVQASFVGKVAGGAVDLGSRLAEGSLFMRLFWPYARLAVVPFGDTLSIETTLGLLMALACVAPTEILIAGSAGVFILFLWDRARAVREGRSETLWALPALGTSASVAVSLVFVVGAAVSSVDPRKSLFNMLIWFFYFLVFFIGADSSYRGRAENVVWPFLTGAAFSGLVSVYQKATGWRPTKNWVDVAFAGELDRMVGTFTNPVFFAEMMGLALPLTIALLLKKDNWRDRVFLLLLAGAQGIGLILSSSRGAWLGFAISFAVLAVFYDWRMLPLGALAGGLGLALAPDILQRRLLSSFSLTDSSNSYRVFIWRGSLAMLRDHLFRGIGLGAEAYSKVYPEYMIIQTPAPHAHSTFLQYLIEVGLFGFLAMAHLFVVWLHDGLRAIFSTQGRKGHRWREIAILAACIAAVAGNLLEGIIDYTWYSPKVTVVFWAIVGMASGTAASLAARRCGKV